MTDVQTGVLDGPPAGTPSPTSMAPDDEPPKLYWLSAVKISTGEIVPIYWNASDCIEGHRG